MFVKGAEWPLDSERIDSYTRFELLFEGDHRAAFAELIAHRLYNKSADGLTYLVFAYPSLIVNVLTNLLVGAAPVISYEDDRHAAALQAVTSRCRFPSVLTEAVQAAGYYGDAVMVVHRGPQGVVIEPKPAWCYYPTLNPDNCREVKQEALAWEREWQGRKVVRVDRYEAGKVTSEAWELSGTKLGDQLDPAEVMEMSGLASVIQGTGLNDRNTLVHLPNLRTVKDYFGRSDYSGGLVTLFEEANERASQIARILDKHADPKMVGPELGLGPDGMAHLRHNYIEYDGQGNPPQYLTWDAQLQAAFSHLDRIEDAIYTMSEVSKVLAKVAAGAKYDSGRAFRMQFAQTLAKRNRKLLYVDPVVKETIRIAVAMELEQTYEETPEPNVRWRDGLPKDLSQDSQTENSRIASGTTSRLSAIRRLDDCDEQTALAELARIAAEKEEFGGVEMPPQVDTPEDEPEDMAPDNEEPMDDGEDDGSEDEA